MIPANREADGDCFNILICKKVENKVYTNTPDMCEVLDNHNQGILYPVYRYTG